MTFLAPGRLYLLIAVAAMAAGYLLLQRRRQQYAVRFTDLALLDKVAPQRPGWRRHVPAAAFLVMLALLVTGFARPTAEVRVPRERATVVVAIDVSASMEATDVQPTRFDAARQAAQRFVERLPKQFNVGVVAFDGRARVVVPPTTDRDLVRTGIDGLDLGPATAIGEAVFMALESISSFDARAAAEPPPARIVLLSDGENTAGRTPEVAADAAIAAGVPVYTIAYGTPDGQVVSGGYVVPVPVDGPALERLADATEGSFYQAASGEELQSVYEDIGSSVGFRSERQEVSVWFIGVGLLAALSTAAASLLWFSRLP
jgi:Ca-activated chloride channel family protein